MARYRIYASKNSVIFEDDTDRNVGLNEVFELWYGTSGATRAVLKWDFESYVNLVEAGTAPALTASTVDSLDFVFTCTYPILESGSSVGDAAYALNLIDDGIYDFEEGLGWWHTGSDIITGYTNWLSANSVTAWEQAGAGGGEDSASASTTADRDASEIRFACDSAGEKAYIWNNYIQTGDTLLCMLRFADEYEALTGNPIQRRLFYSRNTNTVFEPFIEINWNDQITEDRAEIIEGLANPLYLFLYSNGTLTDPVSVDSVTIDGTEISTGITKVATGIYKYDYTLPAGSGGTGTVISDVWGITFTGSLTGTVAQQFTGVSLDNSTLWSGDTVTGQEYLVSLPNLDAEYSTGDTAYIKVLFRREFSNSYAVLKNAEFRIHIPNPNTGEPLLEMYPWTPISYRNENFMIIPFSWFKIGQIYQIDIRYSDGQQLVVDDTERRFKVTA